LRLWAASSDFTDDLRIGDEIIKTAADAYRKLRNTLRYMVGALDGYTDADALDYAEMPALEKWVLHRLSELDEQVRKAYKSHDFKKVFSSLFNFCTNDLSAFYFDIRKDALYCDPLASVRRRACRTVMNALFERLTIWLAPILCFTMEEVWQTRQGEVKGSVHLQEFPETPDEWRDGFDRSVHIESFREIRRLVSETIERMRKESVIRSSLEASVLVTSGEPIEHALERLEINVVNSYSDTTNPKDTLADYLIVSECAFKVGREKISVKSLAEDAAYIKCQRSWKYFRAEGGATITPRDEVAVQQWDSANG